MKKVLIVDDSLFIRKVFSDMFNETKDFKVVGAAQNGLEAISKIKSLRPDLVTLDIEMPVMNGLDALKIIMRDMPLPVVVVSSQTKEGSEETVKALLYGAVDFVTKNVNDLDMVKSTVLATCRNAVNANLNELQKNFTAQKPVAIPPAAAKTKEKLVAIGTSTGGPKALQEVIPNLPGNLPCPVVIVQHMPPGFTKSLADRLDACSQIKVKEAENNEQLQKSTVYVAPGDFHIRFAREGGIAFIKLSKDPPVGLHRPAVNAMFESAAQVYGANCVAVLLTGMGQDGAAGMAKIKVQNGYTIAESQDTAIVYGMPKAAAEIGVVDKILPLHEIANEITRAVI
ncbi:MAG: chemotaxis response regulator protein-glutamate methylesterase [Acidaminococcales bacterium]|nr:chemotaxis response regulator protein-glutamate methylesterase [Acidaminococcales bacterium]